MSKKVMIFSLVLLILFAVKYEVQAYGLSIGNSTSFDSYGLKVVSQQAEDEIERLIEENNKITQKLENAVKFSLDEVTLTIKRNRNDERMKELGCETPSDELLGDLINASKMSEGISQSPVREVSHPKKQIETFKEMYDIKGYTAYHDGNKQYHLIFQTKGYDRHLRNIKTEHFYNGISKGSREAKNWGREIAKIYISKLIGYGISKVSSYISFLPYELLGIIGRPDDSAIYSDKDAMVMTINTAAIQKFVFCYNERIKEWFMALSVNKVDYSVTITQALYIKGRPYNKTNEYNNLVLSGDYYMAKTLANKAFNKNYSDNRCIHEVGGYSKSKNKSMIKVDVFAPRFLIDMI